MNKILLATILTMAACAADMPPSPTGLTVFPTTTIYSGVESGTGATAYKATIRADGASGVTWKVDDPTIASVTGTDTLGTVTALKAGSTTITVMAGGVTAQVPFTVATYNVSDRMAGATAFTTTYTCARSGCHDATGPDISPSGIGKHTDAQLDAATTMGKNPEGGDVAIGAAAHSFSIASAAPGYVGIAAYMRALTPGTPHKDN